MKYLMSSSPSSSDDDDDDDDHNDDVTIKTKDDGTVGIDEGAEVEILEVGVTEDLVGRQEP